MSDTLDTAVMVTLVIGRYGKDEDEERACQAASNVLHMWNMDAHAAYKAFSKWMNGSTADFTAPAYAWLQAEQTAQRAYNAGWGDPYAAYVRLMPRQR